MKWASEDKTCLYILFPTQRNLEIWNIYKTPTPIQTGLMLSWLGPIPPVASVLLRINIKHISDSTCIITRKTLAYYHGRAHQACQKCACIYELRPLNGRVYIRHCRLLWCTYTCQRKYRSNVIFAIYYRERERATESTRLVSLYTIIWNSI